ncbi:TonB-dependent receptor [Phenylobacterium zucineum HLK1]|uniref:TonB-dependent receptor n=1 Tax=Phenylobacterium zucineum (strain HLK1) TaxID=450851 RepID=B4RG04_PHEZH|nr:TonB-dependent receptor [Phenylobacterium zucineum]ACG78817.1 TonB-dependent receptor [Phenylobacterium zucineum HLK1]
MSNVVSKGRLLLLATAAACLPAAVQAQAPATGAAAQTEANAAASETALDVVVVTAQRRVQRGNDVGIAMNVVSGGELEAAGVRQVVDLATQTTNVQIKNTLGGSVPNVTIRGIGLNDYASNNNPAAGVYVDNVYLVSPAMLSFGLFDVDRVEVLKGPQGDLYGRNTTAGAINIISKRPTEAADAEFQVGYGTYDSWLLNGAVGGPLAPTLAGRFAFTTEQQASGWQRNYVTGERNGRIDRTAARLHLEWTPSEAVTALLSAHAGYDRSDQSLYKVDNVLTTDEDAFAGRPRIAGASNNPEVDLKSAGVSLTVDWALAEGLTLTSISAYERFTRVDVGDQDGTRLRQLDSTFRNRINQTSQELRLAYSREALTLIGGAYYSRDTVATQDSYDAPDLLPLLGLSGISTIGNRYHQRTKAYAVFLHGEWEIVPKLTLVSGIRYTKERKRLDDATTFLGPTGGGEVDVFAPVENFFRTSNVSGKLGVNYKLLDDTLLYASVSRGFKSGGFQGQLTFDPSALTPFDDEKLTAYEVGVKSRVLPNLQVNASAFNYDYEDSQFYGPLFDSPVGVLFGITNVGDARVRGVEGDVTWRPVAGLDLRVGAGYIDTEITRSIVPGVAKGSRLPNAPEFTLNGSVKYAWTVTDDAEADISLSAAYQSRVAFDIVRNPPEAREGGYTTVNGEAGLNLGENFRIAVWGKNLFNELHRTQALFTSAGWSEQYSAPRTFGVKLSWQN